MMEHPRILIVDDNEDNRELLSRLLLRQHYRLGAAEDGQQALAMIAAEPYDVILLDLMMPVMNGYQVLEHLKADENLRHIPVIIISAASDIDRVVKGIQLGAEDYLTKPFNMVLLQARIEASLEKKRLRDQEQRFLEALALEQDKSDRLLLSILPAAIAAQLKDDMRIIAESFPEATVMFADIVNFTRYAATVDPAELVRWLNDLFSNFDELARRHGLEKIKTIGDAYMVAGGIPLPRPDHARAVAAMALDIQRAAVSVTMPGTDEPLQMRIGIHTGPVVAGVIGTNRFGYDLWGDTVNIASRMEAQSLPGAIQISPATHQLLQEVPGFSCVPRHNVEIKGVGPMTTYLLSGSAGL